MNGWQTRFLHLSTAAVIVSGLAYLILKYLVRTDDPFALINHPLQPWMLKFHLVAAPCLVFMFGVFWEWHVAAKIRNGHKTNRTSGLVSIGSFVAMTVSGYLIQIVESEGSRWWAVVVHIASSVLFTAVYLVHQWVSIRLRRKAAASEASYVWIGLLAAALACFWLLIFGASAGAQAAEEQHRPAVEPHTRRVYVMGTVCDLEIFGRERRRSLEALEMMVQVLQSTEAQLSTWRQDSLLTRLNRTPVGESTRVPVEICRLLEEVQQVWSETNGAFDPAIGPLIDVWDLRGRGRIPTPEALERAVAVSGLRHFQIHGCEAMRLNSSVWLDSGGFGKGEALDRIRTKLAESHVADPWMVNLGGQIMVSEKPPGQTETWVVALADPLERKPLVETRLSGGSLSTSGVSENDRQEAGFRLSHILDPRTGKPVTHIGSVTVWHQSALVADALSTALFVMGPEEGLRWAENQGIAACFLTPDLASRRGVAVTTSAAFRPLLAD